MAKALDVVFHDTLFVTGHFHLIMGVAAIFGIFGATYYWFPKMFARMMNETLGKLHFWLTFIGVYAMSFDPVVRAANYTRPPSTGQAASRAAK